MTLAFSRAIRSVREHTYLSVVSTGVITAALLLIGIYGLVMFNLRSLVGTWEQDVHVSAYLRADATPEAHAAVQQALVARPEVESVRYVSEADARGWMSERMPELGPVLDDLGEDALPASLEITLRREHTSPTALAAFVGTLQSMGSFEDIDYGQEWVARFNTFLSLLTAMGVVLGGFIGVAALFLVGNTIHLVVYSRRDELEIMRLVGATDGYILSPFLVEGALQGAVGATLALAGLYGVHRGLVLRLHEVLAMALGDQTLRFLPLPWIAALAGLGLALGVGAAFGAVRRFLGKLP
ncbi:MAG: cell division protein FtsX [Myxococcota bacterium]